MNSEPGDLIRERRRRLGLSQRQLALRAATAQAAVSRIERGLVSPTFDTLRKLLLVMGEELVLSSRRLEADWDADEMTDMLKRSPEERLKLALSRNRMAARSA
ncbi:MAG TPA: helix-turn-helix domain-containing protein [Solirubrobacteraceae bacterium]|nr:helix-turn-helix domain-containing protein [Solirubrobacteraceae bacterium]